DRILARFNTRRYVDAFLIRCQRPLHLRLLVLDRHRSIRHRAAAGVGYLPADSPLVCLRETNGHKCEQRKNETEQRDLDLLHGFPLTPKSQKQPTQTNETTGTIRGRCFSYEIDRRTTKRKGSAALKPGFQRAGCHLHAHLFLESKPI